MPGVQAVANRCAIDELPRDDCSFRRRVDAVVRRNFVKSLAGAAARLLLCHTRSAYN